MTHRSPGTCAARGLGDRSTGSPCAQSCTVSAHHDAFPHFPLSKNVYAETARRPFRRERRVWRARSPRLWCGPTSSAQPQPRGVGEAGGSGVGRRAGGQIAACLALDSVGRLGPVKSGTQIYKSTDKCSELSQPLHIERYKSDRDLVLTQHQTPRIAYTLYAANASSEMQ